MDLCVFVTFRLLETLWLARVCGADGCSLFWTPRIIFKLFCSSV